MKEFDYQEWYVTHPECGEVYEKTIQDPHFYMSHVWDLEKGYLRREMEDCRRRLQRSPHYLDFACGTGRTLTFVEEFNDDNTGVDISPFMVEVARKKLRHSRLEVMNICETPWPRPERFDFISCFRFFLRAQPDLRSQTLEALRPLLADDGLLLFSIQQNTVSLNMFSVLLINLFTDNDCRYLSLPGVKRMLAPHGFEIVRVYGIGILPAFLVRRVAPLKRFDRFLTGTQWCRHVSTDLLIVCRKLPRP